MATEQLNLQQEEPEEDYFINQVFSILRDALQPDSELSAEAAVTQLIALLPDKRSERAEVSEVLMICSELAEQIPYNHASMVKLASMVDLCYKSSKFQELDRGGELGQMFREVWNVLHPKDGLAKYVNFQTFEARIYERGLVLGCNLPIWALECAFEQGEGNAPEEHDAYVKAALQHLIIIGDKIYSEVTKDSKQHKWWRWREQVKAVATGMTRDKTVAYSHDTVGLAGTALVAMEAAEHLKAG